MRVISYLCYATKLVKQDKFGPRAIRAVMMGYAISHLEIKKFFICRDVHFNEYVYPFQNKMAYSVLRNQVPVASMEEFDSSLDSRFFSSGHSYDDIVVQGDRNV